MALKVGELFATINLDSKGFDSALSRAGSSLLSTAGKIVSVKKLFDTALSGIKHNAEIEQLQTSFEVMSGSAEIAAEMVGKLRNAGVVTPYETADLARTAQLMMNYGFAAEDAYEQTMLLSDIAQGNSDDLMSIATGYAQMSSAAKVNLQDIKQMINGGFNPLQEIAETTGETMESLYDRISKGQMDVLEIQASIIRSTREGGKYYQSNEKQQRTLNGQISTLKDNWKSLTGELTKPINIALTNTLLPSLNNALAEVTAAAESGGYGGAATKLGEIIGGYVADGITAGMKRTEEKLPDSMKTLNAMSVVGSDAGKEAFKYAMAQAFGDVFSGKSTKRLFDAVTDKTIWQGVGDIFYDAIITNPVKWAKAGAGAVADAYDATLGKVKLPDWLMFANSEEAKRQKETQAQLSNLLDPFTLRETQRSEGALFSAQKYFDNLRDIGADEKQIHELITRYESMFDTKIADGMANIEESRRAQTEAIKQYAKELYASKGESALSMTDLELAFIAFFKSSQDGLADELSGGEKADIMRKALEDIGGLSGSINANIEELKAAVGAFDQINETIVLSLADPALAESASSSGSQIGENFSAGVASGIRAGIADIIAAATEAANAASAGTAAALDEHSPSRVGYGQGMFYAQGIANGILGGLGTVASAVSGIGDIARNGLSVSAPSYGRITPQTSAQSSANQNALLAAVAARTPEAVNPAAVGSAIADALIRSGALSGDIYLDGTKVGQKTAKPVKTTNDRRAAQTVAARGRSEVTL